MTVQKTKTIHYWTASCELCNWTSEDYIYCQECGTPEPFSENDAKAILANHVTSQHTYCHMNYPDASVDAICGMPQNHLSEHRSIPYGKYNLIVVWPKESKWVPAPECYKQHPYGEEGWRPANGGYHEHWKES